MLKEKKFLECLGGKFAYCVMGVLVRLIEEKGRKNITGTFGYVIENANGKIVVEL